MEQYIVKSIYFSKSIENINNIITFLDKINGVVGWGHKPTADKARDYAAKHDLPYIALEDGFLRSLDLGCKGAQPLSLVVDHTGIYYDAERLRMGVGRAVAVRPACH